MKIVQTFCIAAALLFAGCSTDRPSTAVETRPTNAELEQTIKAKLSSDPQLAAADLKVDADADKNQVTLSGNVQTEPARTQAVAMAKSARPGVVVVDKIDVKPRELTRSEYTEDMAREARDKAKATGQKVGDTADDAWIHTKIVAKFAVNSDTPARKIDVDVVNNVVTLRGEVESATAKEEAGRIAKETDGVKAVKNLLKVHAPKTL